MIPFSNKFQHSGLCQQEKFGEYGVYCDGKIVALICDDLLFVKPKKANLAFVGDCPEACPYPGEKPYFLISKEKWDDQKWLSTLFKISAEELPLPKKKNRKKREFYNLKLQNSTI